MPIFCQNNDSIWVASDSYKFQVFTLLAVDFYMHVITKTEHIRLKND